MINCAKHIFSWIVIAGLAIVCLSSCLRLKTIRWDYESVYRVVGIKMIGIRIIPELEYDGVKEMESRLFYESVDTSLFFYAKENRKTGNAPFSVIDWRINEIDVITLEDYDSNHPSGSSLNDVMTVNFWYKNRLCSLKLSELIEHPLMLSDFEPYGDTDDGSIGLGKLSGFPSSNHCRVVIKDAFGQIFESEIKRK